MRQREPFQNLILMRYTTNALKTLACFCLCAAALAQTQPVEIQVNAAASQGPFHALYDYFGYDEPNYTYGANGKKLIAELGALGPARAQIRAHHLLVTGDGTPALKWGSTNVYTLDAKGQPVYDWTIIDRIIDTYMQANARPFVEVGFMPEALSRTPEPYTRHWPKPDDGKGWAEPPKDYAAWAELVHRWVLHSVERYGKAEVEQWSWELWNEPDIFYWRGTPEEYDKLYDYTADAIKRALPTARVGGPGTTGPGAAGSKSASYLKQFLEHCANGVNAVTGKTGTPLDFISYHAKGAPRVLEGRVRMGLRNQLGAVQRGLDIIKDYPRFRALPIVLSESDPEGCAACVASEHPENGYRNTTLYSSYTAAAMGGILQLADRYHADIAGMLTWAFEFEGQPYFEGYRTLATNGIDKPIMNLFRMAGLMQGDRVELKSAGAITLDAALQNGVHEAPEIDGIATRGEREISILVWNYHDDDAPAPGSPVHLTVTGVRGARALVEHYRIDETHSNSYTVWTKMGSPQQPTPEQYKVLEAAGQLQSLTSPEWRTAANQKLDLAFELPRQAVSLLRITW
jgi:xylan 1,4-beta-xylosidase